MMIVLPDDVPSLNVSPHVVGAKGPVVHLAHFIDILDANDLPRCESRLEVLERGVIILFIKVMNNVSCY